MNKVKFGLDNVHIAFMDLDAAEQPAWETPIAIPGAVSFSPTPEGEASEFYADNVKYFVADSNNGYTADLVMALVPDTVLAEMYGWYIDSNGALVEVADGVRKPFALLGQVKGDKRNRRFVYYNCLASRPSMEHTTKEGSITPETDTIPVTIFPIDIDGKNVVKSHIELTSANATAYNGFFTAVMEPGTVASGT